MRVASESQQHRVVDEVRALGPGSRVAIERNADRHVVIGDETSIGSARAVVENANGSRIDGIIACSPATSHIAKHAGTAFESFAGGTPAARSQSIIGWLGRKGAVPGAIHYLTGNQATVTAVGLFLLKRMAVPRKSLHQRVHWAEGKAGL